MVDFINSVITGIGASADSVTSNRIKGTSKFSSHPKYGYDPKCVSVGQDSLGSIATAIASFQRLKREWPDYPGGLLVIDELDSGLHPHAIRRLVGKLQEVSEQLDLQIIATTHSPALIESIFASTSIKKPKNSVAYLMETAAPYLMCPAGLQNILDDMELVPPGIKGSNETPNLRIYLEDNEAKEIFDLLITGPIKRKIGKANGVSIKSIALGVGCDSLANLTSIDTRFQECIFALDADATIKPKHLKYGNVVKLPGKDNKSPERTLFYFVKSLIDDRDSHQASWRTLQANRVNSTHIQAYLLDWEGDLNNRTQAKKWWRDRAVNLKNWGMFKLWMAENPTAIDQFRTDFEQSVKTVAKHLRKLSNLSVGR
jgi:AAA domain, putative AbiEii toxin, Type IV TA system